jgi:CYTH domain-containing protein
MGTEIERKFLVDPARWTPSGQGRPYRQGYLATEGTTVRVRTDGSHGWLTIKAARVGISRAEFEYEIPMDDANWMLSNACCSAVVEKRRHVEIHHGMRWEIDVFEGENAGLLIAEIELPAENTPFVHPHFLLEEVSEDGRYANSSLSRRPYRSWTP